MALREKLAVEISAKTLALLRDLARREGVELEDLFGEALEDLIAKRRGDKPRTNVMDAYQTGWQKFAPLHRKLTD
ncbi:hypothetical protein ANOBCDAF_04163 [Pleomorphomonas sp. T1.2MG-36]|uniref:hypothetical protein n=1 Tax=Pleomorphomonas sp. T1.2MG-36 TaxID=3041167 RepID=UPI0024772FE1|nr:hypothetical protein [Pleomorphomonas sp. T1.2MG-36]CAI9418151.1 hypothetical protein ANOBCDAF_04163 [Pleomorphomonas sp. T1.2MG-36]